MTQPRHDIRDAIGLFSFRDRGAVNHDHGQAKGAGRRDLGLAIGEHRLDELEVSDRPAELPARRRYGEAFFGSGPTPEHTKAEVRTVMERGVGALRRQASFAPYIAGDALSYADFVFLYTFPMATSVANKVFDERISSSGFDEVVISDNQVGSGGGLAIGVQYALTPKLMLGTEAAFYYLDVERKQMTTFENLPEFNTDPEISNSRTTQSFLPSSIYLIFHF